MLKESSIGQRIYDLRIERDIQQGELATAIGIHQSVLNRIEKGSRPARDSEIIAIASFLQVTSDYLLGLSPKRHAHAASPAAETTVSIPLSALNTQERHLIQTFRLLDSRGQSTVTDTLEREFSYVKTKEKEA